MRPGLRPKKPRRTVSAPASFDAGGCSHLIGAVLPVHYAATASPSVNRRSARKFAGLVNLSDRAIGGDARPEFRAEFRPVAGCTSIGRVYGSLALPIALPKRDPVSRLGEESYAQVADSVSFESDYGRLQRLLPPQRVLRRWIGRLVRLETAAASADDGAVLRPVLPTAASAVLPATGSVLSVVAPAGKSGWRFDATWRCTTRQPMKSTTLPATPGRHCCHVRRCPAHGRTARPWRPIGSKGAFLI